jgi:hypothetical protein
MMCILVVVISIVTIARPQVPPSASFDDILAQKERQLSKSLDQEKVMEVEAAYDILFMQVCRTYGCNRLCACRYVCFGHVHV